MFANVFGVIAIVIVAVVAIQSAKVSDYWPRSACATAAPYGPHDYRCKYFIGQ